MSEKQLRATFQLSLAHIGTTKEEVAKNDF